MFLVGDKQIALHRGRPVRVAVLLVLTFGLVGGALLAILAKPLALGHDLTRVGAVVAFGSIALIVVAALVIGKLSERKRS